MKILFVCHRVPYPPTRGGKIRPFNIIRHFSGRGHDVTVASLARSVEERNEAAALRGYCAKAMVEVIPRAGAVAGMIARLPTLAPSSFGYFRSAALAARIDAELHAQRFDLVFVHCSSAAPYVSAARGPVKVLDYGDMDSQKWRAYAERQPFPQSMATWLEAVKLERTERLLSARFDLCTCTTRAELESLRRIAPVAPSDWFPNGVDAEFFAPSRDPRDPYDANLMTFLGRMDYYPNQLAVQEFCTQVLPRLQAHRPASRFEIVGAAPPRRIRALGRLPGVTVTGAVPDVRPYVRRAALTVAPLRIARGTQNKILESMAMGVPVVCSAAAAGGVDAVHGEHLLIADTAQDYVNAITALQGSRAMRERLAAAGRARVLSHHSWRESMARLDQLLDECFTRGWRGRGARAAASAGHAN